jgi:hypothetical protein
MHRIKNTIQPIWILLFCLIFLLNACYTYRIQTQAQPGTELMTTKANSYFWGLVQKPKAGITTPNCDSLNAKGMSVVQVKTNFGNALITVLTLGIWSPLQVSWQCSKPCPKEGEL